MKRSSTARASSSSSGVKKPRVFTSTIGLRYSPRRLSVMASSSSSSVPEPPGSAIAAWLSVSIMCLRVRRSSTSCRSVSPLWPHSRSAMNRGRIPITRPPALERTVGQRAHRPGRAAAVDDSDALLGEYLAKAVRGGAIVGVRDAARRAVHAHGPLDGAFGGSRAHGRGDPDGERPHYRAAALRHQPARRRDQKPRGPRIERRYHRPKGYRRLRHAGNIL